MPVYDVDVRGRRVYAAGAGSGGRVWALRFDGRPLWTRLLDGDARALAVLQGRVHVGGHFTEVCATRRVSPVGGDCVHPASPARDRLAAFTAGGRVVPWSPMANSRAGVLTLDGSPALAKLAAGGTFTAFGASQELIRPHFAQFSSIG